jgi:hypothetical protein
MVCAQHQPPRTAFRLAFGIAGALCSFPGICATPDRWVPVRWQGGPLEIHRRAAELKAPVRAEIADLLGNWYKPATLDLLSESPVNCLLVTWSTGAEIALEGEQQRIAGEYAGAARARGMAVLGSVYPGADPKDAVSSAVTAGLDGLVLEGDFTETQVARFSEAAERLARGRLTIIPMPASSVAGSASPVLATGLGTSPGVRVISDGAILASVSSEPWIDSNSWVVRRERAHSGRPVWLGYSLDDPRLDNYLRAIADAAAAGGQWVLAPDDSLRLGLLRKDSDALGSWRRIASWLKFFEQRPDWRAFAPVGPLAIIVDPHTGQADMEGENLNLVARRRIPYEVISRASLSEATSQRFRAILATSVTSPAAGERALLSGFAERGGLVIAGPSWGTPVPAEKEYVTQSLGQGRIVVYRDEAPDPEALAKELLSLLGKGNVGMRLFNAPAVLCSMSASEGRRRLLVQMVNYASGSTGNVTLRIDGQYRTARLLSPDEPPSDVPVESAGGRTEVAIQRIGVYTALLLER